MVTRDAKYAIYSNWRPNTLEPLSRGEETELYDYTTHDGHLEIENRAGRSPAEHGLRATLERAIRDELHAPLPTALVDAQRNGLSEYHRLAALEQTVSDYRRLRALEQLLKKIDSHLPR